MGERQSAYTRTRTYMDRCRQAGRQAGGRTVTDRANQQVDESERAIEEIAVRQTDRQTDVKPKAVCVCPLHVLLPGSSF